MSIPAHLRGAKAPVNEEIMEEARRLARDFAQLDADIEAQEARLSEMKERRLSLQHKELPDLLGRAKTDKIGIPELNVDVEVKPYYKASIAADWEIERQEAAFAHLEEHGHGDVIRSVVTVSFPKEEIERAHALVEHIRQSNEFGGLDPILGMSVPWNTLTSLVKSEYESAKESGEPFPMDLETIGATVGRIAKIKKRK